MCHEKPYLHGLFHVIRQNDTLLSGQTNGHIIPNQNAVGKLFQIISCIQKILNRHFHVSFSNFFRVTKRGEMINPCLDPTPGPPGDGSTGCKDPRPVVRHILCSSAICPEGFQGSMKQGVMPVATRCGIDRSKYR